MSYISRGFERVSEIVNPDIVDGPIYRHVSILPLAAQN